MANDADYQVFQLCHALPCTRLLFQREINAGFERLSNCRFKGLPSARHALVFHLGANFGVMLIGNNSHCFFMTIIEITHSVFLAR